MKKIAVFTSADGEATERLVSLFNEGNRLRVDLIVTDSKESGLGTRLAGKDVEIMVCDTDMLNSAPSQILDILLSHNIDLVAIDSFIYLLPSAVNENYAGRIVSLSDAEEAPREVVAAVSKLDEVPGRQMAETAGETERTDVENNDTPENEDACREQKNEGKSVDEEWAETLQMNYDPSRLRTTPPPVPGAANPAQVNPASAQNNPSDGNFSGSYQSNPYQNSPYQNNVAGVTETRGEREPMPPAYLVWAIIIMVFCCTIPGIVAIIYSSQVSSKYNMGDIEGAKRASRYAQIWIIVSFVLGVLSSTLYLPIMLAS